MLTTDVRSSEDIEIENNTEPKTGLSMRSRVKDVITLPLLFQKDSQFIQLFTFHELRTINNTYFKVQRLL